jgi:hypothetical protein
MGFGSTGNRALEGKTTGRAFLLFNKRDEVW